MSASISFGEFAFDAVHIARMAVERSKDPARGERIRFVRSEILHLGSQERLAKMLTQNGHPVTRGAVGNWEQGKDVALDSLSAICQLSGVNLDWLAYNKGPAPGAPHEDVSTWRFALEAAVEQAFAEGADAVEIHQEFERLLPMEVYRKLALLSEMGPDLLQRAEAIAATASGQQGKSDADGREDTSGSRRTP